MRMRGRNFAFTLRVFNLMRGGENEGVGIKFKKVEGDASIVNDSTRRKNVRGGILISTAEEAIINLLNRNPILMATSSRRGKGIINKLKVENFKEGRSFDTTKIRGNRK